MPRFFFDIYDGEITRDEEGYELAGLDAARALVRPALSAMLADELRQGHAPQICIHVRDQAGERVITATGRGEILFGEAPKDLRSGRGETSSGCSLSALDRAAQHAIAARQATGEDGCAALRHWADMLMWAVGCAVSRRTNTAPHPKLR